MGVSMQGSLDLVNVAETVGVTKEEMGKWRGQPSGERRNN